MRLLLPYLFLLAAIPARANFDVPIIHCKPDAVAVKVKEKTLFWKQLMERQWCTGNRHTARYILVVSCTKMIDGYPHLTTFDFIEGKVVEKAKVDFDPALPEAVDRGLPHGLAHAILPTCMPRELPLLNLPAWALEGLAQYYVVALVEDAKKEFGRQGLGTLQDVDQLIFENSRALSFYTEAGLFVKFLVDELGGSENFKGFLVDLNFDGTPPRGSLEHLAQYGRVFKKRYGMTIPELDTAFKAYMKRVLAGVDRDAASK